jgi:hypothetical protein
MRKMSILFSPGELKELNVQLTPIPALHVTFDFNAFGLSKIIPEQKIPT